MIKVMLADDQEIVREGIKMMLSLDGEIRITGEAGNGRELLMLLEERLPDVILMDIRMPGLDGVATTEIIKREHPEIRVIILTTFNDDEYIFRGLKNGADGYILKDSGSDDIIRAIKTAYSGNILLNPEVAAKVVKALNTTDYTSKADMEAVTDKKAANLCLLTPREREVARLVAEGKNNKEIGNNLFLTEGTVKNYVTRILEKLELSSRTELALYVHDTH